MGLVIASSQYCCSDSDSDSDTVTVTDLLFVARHQKYPHLKRIVRPPALWPRRVTIAWPVIVYNVIDTHTHRQTSWHHTLTYTDTYTHTYRQISWHHTHTHADTMASYKPICVETTINHQPINQYTHSDTHTHSHIQTLSKYTQPRNKLEMICRV